MKKFLFFALLAVVMLGIWGHIGNQTNNPKNNSPNNSAGFRIIEVNDPAPYGN